MKQPWPTRLALALCALLPACALYAAQEGVNDTSRYKQFMVYPHRKAGYEALRAGNESVAIAEFERARSLAPESLDTALDLAEAYRHFGHAAQAQQVLEAQRRFTPDDARLQAALKAGAPAADCSHANSPVCRAKRGFAALNEGHLDDARTELDAADFSQSTEGLALRHALAQRAIYLDKDDLALQQLAALDAGNKLSAQEGDQWFTLLLRHGQFDTASSLQERPGFASPQQDLAMAQALLQSGDRKRTVAYMTSRRPDFTQEADEGRWLTLFAQAARDQPESLARYAPRYPGNTTLQARLVVPLAVARDNTALVQSMLARLPADAFREERFQVELQQGQYTEAQQQAQALAARPEGNRQLDPLSFQLMQTGATLEAKQLLLASYPYTGNPQAQTLLARLAVLAQQQPALFSADDRARLQQPLADVPLRVAQVAILAALHDCLGIRTVMADHSPDYPASLWQQLGDCYGNDMPGLAEYAYAEANKRKPDSGSARALAYQAYSTKDYPTALEAWRSVPSESMQPADLIAAATTALGAHAPSLAHAWLDRYVAQGGGQDDTYWWLRAQTDELEGQAAARSDLENAVALHPDPRYYQRLAALQTSTGDTQGALRSLERASALAPEDAQLAATLGYAYAKAGMPDKAVVLLERAHKTNPDDPVLTRQLLYTHQQLGENAEAQAYATQAIDQLDANGIGSGPADGSQEDEDQQRYTLQRLHEDLGRKWLFNADMTIGDTVSSAANTAAPGVTYRSYLQLEAQYRIDPSLFGGDLNTLAVYARVFAGSGESGAVWPVHAPMLGVGVHWKPLVSQNIVLSVEQQTPLSNSRITHNDTMLRASGSWAFSPNFSDDWHVGGKGWFAQNFYVDLAYYLRAEQAVLTADYKLGWHRKLLEGQTLEPYVHLQYTGIDRSNGLSYERDGRMGIGVQWNLWYGETRYDAYPHRLSVAIEGQHAFTSYLHEKNTVFLIVRTQW